LGTTSETYSRKVMGLLNSNTLNDYVTKTIPQNARNIWDAIVRSPEDLKKIFANPNGYQDVMAAAQQQIPNPQSWIDQGINLAGMAPVAPIGMFIGKGATIWDAVKAKQAENMLAKGVDPRKVWSDTGTFRGVDKQLRQEIPDNNVFQYGPVTDFASPIKKRFAIDEIEKAYPLEAKFSVSGGPLKFADTPSGSFDGNRFAIYGDNQTSTALHELQHAIQQREGWAKGGSPDEMRQILGNGELTGLYSPEELNNAYKRLAGETEARLTQARMNMSMPERLQSYPLDMMDVPPEQQIVRGLLGEDTGPAMSYANEAAQKAKQVSPPYLNNKDYPRMDLPEITYAGRGDTFAGYPTLEAYQKKLADDAAQAKRISDAYYKHGSLTARYGLERGQNTLEKPGKGGLLLR
jgi:hypothetical protein